MRTVAEALARTVAARYPDTAAHAARVAAVAAAIAERMGWAARRMALLEEAALVHDVGKVALPDAVLRKPGALTADEARAVRAHPVVGARMLEGLLTHEQCGWVRHHHERQDGDGYPDGLTAERIPEGAAILATADHWDAMTSDRPYRRALPRARAVAEILAGCGRDLAPGPVDALLDLVGARVAAPSGPPAGYAGGSPS